MRAAVILAAILIGSAAVAVDRPRVPAIVADGAVKDCIPLTQIRESLVRDDRTIDFMVSGRRLYRNVLPAACPELGFEERFAYETSLSQLCSTDIITVLHTTGVIRGASCGLGQFQPGMLSPR